MKCRLLLMMLCLALAAPARAQHQPPPEITVEYIEAMKTEIQKMRSLKYTAPVAVRFVSQKEIADLAADIMRREGMDEKYLDAAGRVLHAFGFLDDAAGLKSALDAVLAQQVEGLYDTDANALFVVRENVLPEDAQQFLSMMNGTNPKDFVLSHELAHALQAQHFDLTLLSPLRVKSEDMALAYKCVVEGDAMAVMLNYTMRALDMNSLEIPGMGERMQTIMNTPGAAGPGAFPDVPEIIKAQFIFPYTAGLDLLGLLYRDGGWDAVNRAFTDPPLSTEQILHPEKYIESRDNPVDLDLRGMAAFAPDNAELLDSNVLGEFQTRLLLQLTGPPGDEPDWTAPAAGWDGDRYAAYAAPGAHTILFWAAAWDSAAEAREFFDAYAKVLTHRFGAPAEQAPAAPRAAWAAPCGRAILAVSADRTALVQCADPAAEEAALNTLLSAPARPVTTAVEE